MSSIATPAIMIRRIDFGDFDLIITFFTLKKGKISVIAKSAKKSVKRFAGRLELFSLLDVVYSRGRGKGMPYLQETVLQKPFAGIMGDIQKTAYASYWAELVNVWAEEGETQEEVYRLLKYVLEELDGGKLPNEVLSILFQTRFMAVSGLSPDLNGCCKCGKKLGDIPQNMFVLNLERGGIVCEGCSIQRGGSVSLSKGTVKQLLWTAMGDLKRAGRVRFTAQSIRESLAFLESFVPYHLGKEPKSLKFLKQIRR